MMTKKKTMDLSLKIKQMNKFNEYILQDVNTKRTHRLILEFHGIDPKVGNVILLDEKLSNPKSDLYIQLYEFEEFNEIENNLDKADLAGLISKIKNLLLSKRFSKFWIIKLSCNSTTLRISFFKFISLHAVDIKFSDMFFIHICHIYRICHI